jgi:hypothetical protein
MRLVTTPGPRRDLDKTQKSEQPTPRITKDHVCT